MKEEQKFQEMQKKLNKSDRILVLILELCGERSVLTKKEVKEILGEPSRAQWYKMLAELTTDTEFRPAILTKVDLEGKDFYRLGSNFKRKLFGGNT